MDTIEQLLRRGQQPQGAGEAQTLLSAPEAERILEQLAPLTIEEVGGRKWHTQHEWIERLNLQAHYNAQAHSDEFVVELLVSLDKLQVLVHDLLLIEAWKEFVYPLLASHLAERVDSVTSYVLLYHEITVASLLQVVLFHPHAVESLSEDYALELADWCYRKLTRLNAEGLQMAQPKDVSAEERLRMSRVDELEEKRLEIEFGVMMCSLAILRYLTDGLPRMPMGALSRVVSTNDTLMGLLPLLDRPPWVRTRLPSGGGRPVLEKWGGNGWVAVPPADRLKITQTDGQVWLAVTNLLVEPRSRAKYGMDEFRRERILGLKRHLNDLMFDQLPVLKDLQRVLDELALGVIPDQSGAGRSAALILEAVPVVRDAMLRGRNWRAVAERAKEEHFGKEAARMAREQLEAMVKHLDFLCELQPKGPGAATDGAGAGESAAAGPPPPVKVSTWRKVHDSGVYEPWYDFTMDVDDAKPPEPVEVAAANAGRGTAAPTDGDGAAASVQGMRYRLRPLDVDTTRPLPANGKAVVRWGDLTAEALLQLPELPTRSSEEGAAALWVTVGLLAVDGLVLQVKLKKAPKPKERDRVAGVWYAYHPVAGALTVLRDHVVVSGGGQQVADAKALVEAKGSSASGAGVVKGSGSGRPLVQVVSEPTAGKAAVGKVPAASLTSAPASSIITQVGHGSDGSKATEQPVTVSTSAASGVASTKTASADGAKSVTRGSVGSSAASSPSVTEHTATTTTTAAAASVVEPRETVGMKVVAGSKEGDNAAGRDTTARKPVTETIALSDAAGMLTVTALTAPLAPSSTAVAAEATPVRGKEVEVVGLDDPE
ncbi:hypothetical protein VaNZ11_000280 [Volvox africanus]|uniref:Uncharacterized protein n=1 Tax=Volvox africanus TaxID=51714 RepID=A0ABQ5RMM2_9CHLO|nr:hypothetical protein VaNZ11_000280 [Volvox africanus]